MLFYAPVFGQTPDSTSVVKEESTWPVPKKALLYAIIPGGGQLYNRKWWKVPLVYGAIGAGGYWLYQNQIRYRAYRDLLIKELDTPGSTGYNTSTLRNIRDRYDKSTQQAYVYVGILYILQGVEAYVDAHLAHFDVSDDLSWHIKPSTPQMKPGQIAAPGVSVIIPIGR